MKITSTLTICVLLLLTLSSVGQTKHDTPPPTPSATETREKIAADYVANMVKHDFEASRKDFSKTMADAFSVEKQKEKWMELTSKVGTFQKVEYTKEEKIDANYQLRKRLVFTDQNVSVIFRFNEENQIIGVLYKY